MRCVEILLGESLAVKYVSNKFLGNVSNLLKFLRVCARLPESGADPTIESDSGFNAMDMAVAMGHRNGTCRSQAQYFWQ